MDRQAALHELLDNIHNLETLLTQFEKKYRIRSETFYAAYSKNPEPQDIDTEIGFCDWSATYLAWQARQADYRAEVRRLQGDSPSLQNLLGLVRAEDMELRRQFLTNLKIHVNLPVTEEERALWRKFGKDLEQEYLTRGGRILVIWRMAEPRREKP